MLYTIRFLLTAASLSVLALPLVLLPIAPALAQVGGEGGAPQQIALTQKQIDDLIASQVEMRAVQAKAQPSNSDQPDPKLQSKLEAIAKKNGFAGLDQFEAVTESIGLVMAGIDPETKSYVGPAAVVKKQMQQVQADKSMSAKDKAEAMQELKQALAGGAPAKPPAGNIDLVSKNFDKLSQAFQGTGGE